MTTTTLPVGATTHHTEATLKARYREAMDIYEAWCDRVRRSGGQDYVAAVLQMGEAWDWVQSTKADLEAHRSMCRQQASVGRRAYERTRVGVSGHRKRF